MFIKNNSNIKWENYNCGDGKVVTIEPKATFEIDDKTGNFLLKILGSPKWLVKTDGEEIKKKDK